MMIRLLNLLLVIIILNSCNSTKMTGGSFKNELTEKEKKEGWQLLFDGTTTSGWHSFGKQTVGSMWKVENGILHLDPKNQPDDEDLTTIKDYDNFDLKLQWKVAPNSNSGVIIFVNEDSKYQHPYQTGPEMQILDNDGHPDGKIKKHRAGDLYDLISVTRETVKPVGEWNQVEIIANNGKLDFYLNGEHAVSTTMWDNNWRAMVANSKFKDMPDFGTFKKGKIDLQDHGNEVWFRDIKIKTL